MGESVNNNRVQGYTVGPVWEDRRCTGLIHIHFAAGFSRDVSSRPWAKSLVRNSAVDMPIGHSHGVTGLGVQWLLGHM